MRQPHLSICQSMVKTHEDGKMFQPLPDFSPFSMAERTEEYAGTGKKEAVGLPFLINCG